MFLNTKSTGVRRISLVTGLISGCYFVATLHQPEPGNIAINLANIVLLFVIGFISAWVIVRVISWIINGFIDDKKKIQHQEP